MASLRKENDRGRVGWRLQFRHGKKRRSLWLGDSSKRAANTVVRHVDELVRTSKANSRPDPETVRWAAGIDDRIRDALVKWDLIEATKEPTAAERTCGTFFDAYIDGRTDLKPTTRTKYKQAAKWFTDRIERDRLMADIAPTEIDQWRRWMIQQGLAQATANKHAKRIKKLFAEAVRARIIAESPAADQRIGGEVNRDRDHNITRANAVSILAKCDTEWALTSGYAAMLVFAVRRRSWGCNGPTCIGQKTDCASIASKRGCVFARSFPSCDLCWMPHGL